MQYKSLLFFTFFALIIISCQKENQPPTCQITSPLNDDEFEIGDVITILVEAEDSDGTISEVNFYINDHGINSSSSFPYSYQWNTSGQEEGIYKIKVIARDDKGASKEDVVEISIDDPTTISDYDGNIYKIIQIGDQTWMSENLKTTHYSDGTAIPLVEDSFAWAALTITDKAYSFYDNSTTNGDTYGALYTWAAAMNGAARSDANPSGIIGVCPSGWHLPSDAEWKELTDFLGGQSVAGGKLKEAGTTHWYSPNTGATNESGFTALPGGFRVAGGFAYLGRFGYWWSTTEFYTDYAGYRYIDYYRTNVLDLLMYKQSGFSVRCVKD